MRTSPKLRWRTRPEEAPVMDYQVRAWGAADRSHRLGAVCAGVVPQANLLLHPETLARRWPAGRSEGAAPGPAGEPRSFSSRGGDKLRDIPLDFVRTSALGQLQHARARAPSTRDNIPLSFSKHIDQLPADFHSSQFFVGLFLNVHQCVQSAAPSDCLDTPRVTFPFMPERQVIAVAGVGERRKYLPRCSVAVVAGNFQVTARNLKSDSARTVLAVTNDDLTDVASNVAAAARLLQANTILFRRGRKPHRVTALTTDDEVRPATRSVQRR